ncbi:hypothetical protein F4U94_22815 [Sphingobium limneticum]|uniref:hypothetical protein n=1 Tax=Sphingobium limneticum TaxID=1007511 RepID=UPI00123C941C|nr:hypothetical protein [Sphingobium limneticum]KAA9009659.1 hypothetical protein F4U94_22815 [Sphingobium limneticum]
MTFLTASIAALVVLHIYHRIGVAINKADILAKALDAHLATGKDYRGISSSKVGQAQRLAELAQWRAGKAVRKDGDYT